MLVPTYFLVDTWTLSHHLCWNPGVAGADIPKNSRPSSWRNAECVFRWSWPMIPGSWPVIPGIVTGVV